MRHATPRSLWGAATAALNAFAVSSPGGACKATAACGPTPWAYVPGIRRWWRPFTLVRICGHTVRAGPLPPHRTPARQRRLGAGGLRRGRGRGGLVGRTASQEASKRIRGEGGTSPAPRTEPPTGGRFSHLIFCCVGLIFSYFDSKLCNKQKKWQCRDARCRWRARGTHC